MSIKGNSKRGNIINVAFIITVLVVGFIFYKKYNFNEFTKAANKSRISSFERDSNTKTGKYDSYKISSKDYNDAMFYKTINVVPNTNYRVTCKIKTENVESQKKGTDSGAHISIGNSIEKSDNVTGTTDWKDITFYFKSKNRTQVDLGFRLGGFEDNCKRNSMVFRF